MANRVTDSKTFSGLKRSLKARIKKQPATNGLGNLPLTNNDASPVSALTGFVKYASGKLTGQARREALLEKIYSLESEGKYIFKPKESVVSFLLRHSYLLGLLDDAYLEIRKIFPNDPLYLEYFRDPESAYFTRLFIIVTTDLKGKEALDKLHELDDQWWMDNLDRGKNKLSIALGYR
jgi:hypothetical protein